MSKALPIVALLCAYTATAQVPHLLNYQGRITAAGVNLDGPGQFKFALVNGDGSQAYWMNAPDLSPADGEPDTPVSLTVSKGLYAVALGDTAIPNMAAIPPAAFAHPEVHLRIWFNDGTNGWERMAPDQRLAAVAYAMMADTVPDGAITTEKLAAGAVTGAKIAPGAVGTTHLAPGAVTADRIAEGAVTPESIGAETAESVQARIDLLGSSMAGGMGALKAILTEGRKDACIHIISDSTNHEGRWSGFLAESVGELFPKYTIKTTHMVGSGPGWTEPEILQEGAAAETDGERRWEFPAGATYTPNGPGAEFPMPAGDLDIRVRARVDNPTVAQSVFFAKWGEAGARGFYFGQDVGASLRKLFLVYTTDGSTLAWHHSTVPITANGIADGEPYWSRVTVDIDNGSGGKTFTFYTSKDGTTWTQLGAPVTNTQTGTAPIAGSSALCSIGGYGGIVRFAGAIYAAQICTGINGPVTHPQNLDAWVFNEGSAKLTGTPELWITNAAWGGAAVESFLAKPDLNYCRNHSPQVILISLNINNPRDSGGVFLGKMQTLADRVRAIYGPIPKIVFLTQNPTVKIPHPIDPYNQHGDTLATHRIQLISWASGKGFGVIDTFGALLSDPRPIEMLVGTNAWSSVPIVSLSGNGTTVTVNVDDMSYLSHPQATALAIMETQALDGSPSPHNKPYRITAKSTNLEGPGWVQFASSLTDAIAPEEGVVGPCDAIHPSTAGNKVWAATIFSAFKKGIP